MDTLSNPILNSPYEAPERHFALGPNGPTGEILPGRRPSESFIPVPVSKKMRGKKGGPEQESSNSSTSPASVGSRTASSMTCGSGSNFGGAAATRT